MKARRISVLLAGVLAVSGAVGLTGCGDTTSSEMANETSIEESSQSAVELLSADEKKAYDAIRDFTSSNDVSVKTWYKINDGSNGRLGGFDIVIDGETNFYIFSTDTQSLEIYYPTDEAYGAMVYICQSPDVCTEQDQSVLDRINAALAES